MDRGVGMMPPPHDGAAEHGLGRSPDADGRQPFAAPTRTPRLLLRDRDDPSERVDGAWWPRTGNLTSELHDLIAVLTPRLGATLRVAFDWNALSLSQRSIDAPDGIEVDGPLPDQPAGVMYVFGADEEQLRLLVIDAATETERATAQLNRASGTSPSARPAAPRG
ncbi:DUF5994 family protein [Nocardia asteroides]|uniref:DUF5994 family protein n=1 Tax=Nocardia asteroides TaxID=1824 RepID=UPI001E3E511D|nr:DUF5994 family protein [Nocardia asteroides]UGT59850.1 DUF5994 family protein [Nocardia asteroides]